MSAELLIIYYRETLAFGKYEEIYLNDYESMGGLKEYLKRYCSFYNSTVIHQSLEYSTPDDIYYKAFSKRPESKAA